MSDLDIFEDCRWDTSGRTVYVLGLDYEVKDAIPWEQAVTNILQGTMTPFMVHPTKRIRSAGGRVDMAKPLIARLNYWHNVPRARKRELTDHASTAEILRRDGRTCGYCGEHATTADHIKPKERCKKDKDPYDGTTWGNLVAACWDCNQKKRNRTPEEAGMKLLWTPYVSQGGYDQVQKTVWRILETGEGYATEENRFEGILEKPKVKK